MFYILFVTSNLEISSRLCGHDVFLIILNFEWTKFVIRIFSSTHLKFKTTGYIHTLFGSFFPSKVFYSINLRGKIKTQSYKVIYI